MSHLRPLEAEAIHVIREVAAELEKPVLLFSGGKDSIVLLRLAEKAFRPAGAAVRGDARRHRAQLPGGDRVPRPRACRTCWWPPCRSRSTPGASGGPRRRATGSRPRRCSTRSRSTASTPRSAARAATRSGRGRRSASSRSATTSGSGTRAASGPSCGTSTTAASGKGEHVRVFPISNWTELDVWEYIRSEGLELPSIYFAHEREVFERDGMLYAASDFLVRWTASGRSPRRCATGRWAT